MRTLLNRWNTIWLRPLTDEEALIILDSYNKTRYSRRKKKEGLLELASREPTIGRRFTSLRSSTMMVVPTVRWSPTSGTSVSTSYKTTMPTF